jgi:hypothetical protein
MEALIEFARWCASDKFDSRELSSRALSALAASTIQSRLDYLDATVDRFLQWRLPDTFAPDCGISFTPLNHPNSWPTGTNLLTAAQAKDMLRHVLAAHATQADALAQEAKRLSSMVAAAKVDANNARTSESCAARQREAQSYQAQFEAAIDRLCDAARPHTCPDAFTLWVDEVSSAEQAKAKGRS